MTTVTSEGNAGCAAVDENKMKQPVQNGMVS